MVTELEEEPSGDLWIILDLNSAVHRGRGEYSTLEYAVVLAASLTAELLGSSERRAVGLLAVGQNPTELTSFPTADQTVILPPQRGQGQLWRILAALAPIQTGTLAVADLLHRNRTFLGKGHTVILITPQIGLKAPDWIAELLLLRRSGVESSVMAVLPAQPDRMDDNGEIGGERVLSVQDRLADLLARQEIPVHFVEAGTPLRPALTYRRKRTVLRTTPTGGVVSYEVEEEVG
jgi:uncharacterized protein (DUF58 family)